MEEGVHSEQCTVNSEEGTCVSETVNCELSAVNFPIRSCVGCREPSDKKRLIRIVRASDGVVRVDPTGKMSGRGAYLCGKKDCLRIAIKHKKLGRALRCDIPASVAGELETLVVDNDAEN